MKLVAIGMTTLAAFFSIGQAMAADGKAVYDKACEGCHSGDFPKAAQLGDKATWAPLIKRGSKDLVASIMKGKGKMPAKGKAGNEEEVAAAVEYMMKAVK